MTDREQVRIDDLERSTRSLSEQIKGLNTALARVRNIQERQVELEATALETRTKAEENRIEIENLEETYETRDKMRYSRRLLLLIIGIAIVVTVQVHDLHVEHCVGAHDRGSIPSAGQVYVCDLTFPVHSHFAGSWPTEGNLVGFLAYGLLLLIGIAAVAGARASIRSRKG